MKNKPDFLFNELSTARCSNLLKIPQIDCINTQFQSLTNYFNYQFLTKLPEESLELVHSHLDFHFHSKFGGTTKLRPLHQIPLLYTK